MTASLGPPVRVQTPARRALRLFLRSPSGLVGLALVLTVVLCALLAPQVAPYDPVGYNPADRMQGPSLGHPLGTDLYGRDTFSRVVFGSRVSRAVSTLSIALALTFGGLLGALAGFYLGWVDGVVMRVSDLFLAFPAILLAIALLAFLGGGFWNLTLAIAVAYAAPFTRVMRAAVLRSRGAMFVEASTALGDMGLRTTGLQK